jgi:hypothetical protein
VTEKNQEDTTGDLGKGLALGLDALEPGASVTETPSIEVPAAVLTVGETLVIEEPIAGVPVTGNSEFTAPLTGALQQEALGLGAKEVGGEAVAPNDPEAEGLQAETANQIEGVLEITPDVESLKTSEPGSIQKEADFNKVDSNAILLASPRAPRIRERAPSRRTTLRERRRSRATTRKNRKRTIYGILGGLVAGTLILGLALPSFAGLITPSSKSTNEGISNAGTYIPVQPSRVLEDGESYGDYSVPPTSGPSYATGVDWGAYTEQQANESIVRNLEQGAIVVNYNLSNEAQVSDLISYIEAQPGYPGCFIAQPNGEIAAGNVTLTSWGWVETYAGVDRPSMQQFVDDHKNQAPLFEGPVCGANATLPESVIVEDLGN